MRTLRILLGLFIIAGLFVFSGCSEDEEPGDLSIVSITGTGTDLETGDETTVDLNAATAPENVPLDVTIKIVFSKDVDEATVSTSSVSITAGDTDVSLSVDVSGAEVTVSPSENLARGTNYTLELGEAITANDGGIFTSTSRTFKTAGRAQVTPPQSDKMEFYMDFNGEYEDETGSYDIEVVMAPEFSQDRFGFASSAAFFPGNGEMLDVLDSESLLTSSITVSFWMKVTVEDTNKLHSYGVLGTCGHKGLAFEMGGNDDPDDVNYIWLKPFTHHDNSQGGTATAWSDRINGNPQDDFTLVEQWTGDFSQYVNEKWVHVVLTYDATTWDKIVYIDGTVFWHENIGEGFDNPWTDLKYFEPDPEFEDLMDRNWGIGFYGSSKDKITGWSDYSNNPRTFSGYLDDVRIWSVPLSGGEVQELYNAEKP